VPDSALTKITLPDNCNIGKEVLNDTAAQTVGSNLIELFPGHPFYLACNTS